MVRVEKKEKKKNLHENANNICIVYRATGNIDPCNPIPVYEREKDPTGPFKLSGPPAF